MPGAVAKPEATKPEAAKNEPAKNEPAKPGATGSSGVPPIGAKPSEPVKPSDPIKPAGATPSVSSTGSTAGSPSSASAAPQKPGMAGSPVPPVGSGPKPSEPAKPVEPAKPAGAASSPSGAPSNLSGGAAPLKPGSTGSSAVPPAATARPGELKADSPAKPGPTGSSAIKPDVPPAGAKPSDAKPSDAKPADGKPSGTTTGSPSAAGPTRVTEPTSLTDGPILDMKAKRVPDPAEAAKAGASRDAARDAAKDAAKGQTRPDAKSADTAAKARAGLGAVAASGLLGGLIGAGLLYGVTTYHRASDPRLDNLDKAVAGLATKDAVAALDKRIAAEEQALKPLPEAIKRAEAAAKTAGDKAQEALQKAGSASAAPTGDGAAPAPAVPADIAARLDALDQRVSALQEEPGRDGNAEAKAVQAQPQAQPSDGTALAALDERIKTLEAAGKDSGAAQDVTQKLAALQGEIESRTKANETADAGLAKRLDEVQKSLDAKIGAATQAVQEASQAGKQAAEASQARAEESVKGIDRRLQEQADKLATLDKALDQTAKAATVQSALRIVAADRIATALDAGQPYPEALASLRGQEPADSKRVAALSPFADKGAPTPAKLSAEFRTISAKIAEAKRAAQAKAVAESGSVGDRLMNMASSLVQVKRADAPAQGQGAAAGGGADGSTAQVQAALDNGDLSAAATAFAALPEEAKAQAGDFGARLNARAEAGKAAQSLLADAFTGLPPAR
nr:hypothetical protein [Methylorubrum salsuginis]